MRTFLSLLAAVAVIGLAFWAYQENYETKAAMNRAEHLQNQIADARAHLSMLRAEWAYENRPDRLRALVEMNFSDLKLQSIDPSQFGSADQLPYAPKEDSAGTMEAGDGTGDGADGGSDDDSGAAKAVVRQDDQGQVAPATPAPGAQGKALGQVAATAASSSSRTLRAARSLLSRPGNGAATTDAQKSERNSGQNSGQNTAQPAASGASPATSAGASATHSETDTSAADGSASSTAEQSQ